jgi:immune inhibitor A
VDWFDRKHEANHTGDRLADVINSPGLDGSTFNLYQEMSYGQLFPHGTVPSFGVATRGWEYGPGFDFTSLAPQGTCAGITYKDFKGSSIYPERIKDGWYRPLRLRDSRSGRAGSRCAPGHRQRLWPDGQGRL